MIQRRLAEAIKSQNLFIIAIEILVLVVGIFIALVPDKTDPPLVIDTDTVLTGTLPAKRFEAVGRRHTDVIQVSGVIEHTKFASSHVLNCRW